MIEFFFFRLKINLDKNFFSVTGVGGGPPTPPKLKKYSVKSFLYTSMIICSYGVICWEFNTLLGQSQEIFEII